MAWSYGRGGLDWTAGKSSLLKGWSHIETGCPGKWWNHHPRVHSKGVWKWLLGIWSSHEHEDAGLDSILEDFSTLVIVWVSQPLAWPSSLHIEHVAENADLGSQSSSAGKKWAEETSCLPINLSLVGSPVMWPVCGRVQFISPQQFSAYGW